MKWKYPKIKKYVEQVVGYLITSASTVYIITKSCASFFSFNPELSTKVSRYSNPRFIDSESRSEILESMMDCIIHMNRKNLLLKEIIIILQ